MARKFFVNSLGVKSFQSANYNTYYAIAELIDERLATKQDLKELELRLTIRLGAMMAASIAIIAALVKLL